MRTSIFSVFLLFFLIILLTNCQTNQQNPCFGMGCSPDANYTCPCIEGPIHYGSNIGHQKNGLFTNGGGRKKNLNSQNNCETFIDKDTIEQIFSGWIDNPCQDLTGSPLEVAVTLTQNGQSTPPSFNMKTTFGQKVQIGNKMIFLPSDFVTPSQSNAYIGCRIEWTTIMKFVGQKGGTYDIRFNILEHESHSHGITPHKSNASTTGNEVQKLSQSSNQSQGGGSINKHQHIYSFLIDVCSQ